MDEARALLPAVVASAILAGATLLSGCASDLFRENADELFRCQRRALEAPGLTVKQAQDIEAGCFDLYEMRRRRVNASRSTRSWADFPSSEAR